ncbi:MAG: 16S rRNA (uracil(1498)-N(3))-methyltransferase [Alphaproteobacteria bacterium]|nr:16S rRNA (uracil(1498)-N(3))-methyltransferase [Alphaproteobacteria bacterium]
MPDRPATRLYIPTALTAGAAIALDVDQAHKLRTVLRLADGAPIAAFNERDGEWLCRLRQQGRRGGMIAVEAQRRAPEFEVGPWLVFAPIKRARLDWLIEKACELGAGAFVPIWTARTQPERLNRERLHSLATAAAEQSERLSVPTVAEPQSFDHMLAAWSKERRLIVCDETGGGVPLAEVLATSVHETPVAVLIGPEGGLTETELDALGKLPIVNRVGLGPRVLRAETAALAALAVFQAIAGDWRRARSRETRLQ